MRCSLCCFLCVLLMLHCVTVTILYSISDHETQSILAHLAGIIMELVGEPNSFTLTFKVTPEVGRAIKRDKLRISSILNHNLVLSFSMQSVPELPYSPTDDADYPSPYGIIEKLGGSDDTFEDDADIKDGDHGENDTNPLHGLNALDNLEWLDDDVLGSDDGVHNVDGINPLDRSPASNRSIPRQLSPSPTSMDLPENDFNFQSTDSDEDYLNEQTIQNTLENGNLDRDSEDSNESNLTRRTLTRKMSTPAADEEDEYSTVSYNSSSDSLQPLQQSTGNMDRILPLISNDELSRHHQLSSTSNLSHVSCSNMPPDEEIMETAGDLVVPLPSKPFAQFGLLQSGTKCSGTPSLETSPVGSEAGDLQSERVRENAGNPMKGRIPSTIMTPARPMLCINTNTNSDVFMHSHKQMEFSNVEMFRAEKRWSHHKQTQSVSFTSDFSINSPASYLTSTEITSNAFSNEESVTFTGGHCFPSRHDRSIGSGSIQSQCTILSDETFVHLGQRTSSLNDAEVDYGSGGTAGTGGTSEMTATTEADSNRTFQDEDGTVFFDSDSLYSDTVKSDRTDKSDKMSSPNKMEKEQRCSLLNTNMPYLHDLPSTESVNHQSALDMDRESMWKSNKFSPRTSINTDLVVANAQIDYGNYQAMERQESMELPPQFGYETQSGSTLTTVGSGASAKSNRYMTDLDGTHSTHSVSSPHRHCSSSPQILPKLECKARNSDTLVVEEDYFIDEALMKHQQHTQSSHLGLWMRQSFSITAPPQSAHAHSTDEDGPDESCPVSFDDYNLCDGDDDIDDDEEDNEDDVDDEDEDEDEREHGIIFSRHGRFAATRAKIKQTGQLQLSNGCSTNSIPLGTIQVTTPGNTHTHTIWHNESSKSRKSGIVKESPFGMRLNEDLTPIKDTMRDDAKEHESPSLSGGLSAVAINSVMGSCRSSSSTCTSTAENVENAIDELMESDFAEIIEMSSSHRHGSVSQFSSLDRFPDIFQSQHLDYSSDDEDMNSSNTLTLERKSANQITPRPPIQLPCISKSNLTLTKRVTFNGYNAHNQQFSSTPKNTYRRPMLRSQITRKKKQRRAQTCIERGGLGLNGLFDEPDTYQSIVIDSETLSTRSLCMMSTERSSAGNVLKFQKPFNKMVADQNGNIFIGTDKYIRYITYNDQIHGAQQSGDLLLQYTNSKRDKSSDKYRKFRKQEKLLYELKPNEHLVSMWNQDGKIC